MINFFPERASATVNSVNAEAAETFIGKVPIISVSRAKRAVIFLIVNLNGCHVTDREADKVVPGRKVQIHFDVFAEDLLVDSTRGKPPLYYVHGGGGLLPGIQKHLEEKREGDEVEFVLSPEEAYGAFNPSAVVEVPLSEMPKRELRTGMILQEDAGEGKVRIGRIQEIKENSVVINFNHPMAGKTLRYKIIIASVNNV